MIIRVRVIPNAKESDVVGRVGSTVRLKVAAPAIDGKANMELCRYLAEFFEVRHVGNQIDAEVDVPIQVVETLKRHFDHNLVFHA